MDDEKINTRFLNQLCDSNVSILGLYSFKLTFPITLIDPDFLAAMAKLIHPSSGNLRSLTLKSAYSDVSDDVKKFYDLMLDSSSLHKLQLYPKSVSIHSSLHLLETNSSLTDVTLHWRDEMRSCSQSLVDIFQHNNVLQHLKLSLFSVPDDEDILSNIITALQGNTVLKKMILCIKHPEFRREQISQYMEENTPIQLRWSCFVEKIIKSLGFTFHNVLLVSVNFIIQLAIAKTLLEKVHELSISCSFTIRMYIFLVHPSLHSSNYKFLDNFFTSVNYEMELLMQELG